MARVQQLRSSVTRARPAGYEPGIEYINFPDRQIGYFDAGGVATDVVAVRFWSPGARYVLNELVAYEGSVYRALGEISPGNFDPALWSSITAEAGRVYMTPDRDYVITGSWEFATPLTTTDVNIQGALNVANMATFDVVTANDLTVAGNLSASTVEATQVTAQQMGGVTGLPCTIVESTLDMGMY